MKLFSFLCNNNKCGYQSSHLLSIWHHKEWGICNKCRKGILVIINNLNSEVNHNERKNVRGKS
jgi:predicted Zn-dependent protease